MPNDNKRNLVFFEAASMKALYDCMEEWQLANHKRLLSVSIQQEGGGFCCIALTNPTEVVITDESGRWKVSVSSRGELHTFGAVLGI